ncbi:uncharacterized protein isoform X3 [Choristoneura fumiferana]|uniref:uncharacterized protein isoform X3 n=1 Tax=Choristoneura fumiferana TaxID=7141 RepID=UPI003D157C18
MKFSDKIDDERIQIENVRSNIKFWQQPLFRQIFVALGPMALIFSSGMGLGTATVMVPQIKAINSSIQIDGEMESWFYSGNSFAAIITVLTVPYLAQIKDISDRGW